ncbi:MAG: WD40 repeat domain-containing protein [bacterium]|nr:WD40 repeat domain-containing protein [bacterium]
MLLGLLLATIAVPQSEPPVARARVYDVALLPDGNLLLATDDGRIVAADPATGEPVPGRDVFASHDEAVRKIEVGPKGELVAASFPAGRVALVRDDDVLLLAVDGVGSHFWIVDVATGKVRLDRALDVRDPFQEFRFPTCMRWSPDGRWLGMSLGKGLIPSSRVRATRRSGNATSLPIR